MEKLLLRPEECAEALGIGRSKVYELIGTGRLESMRVGRRRLIPRDAVVAFVQGEREVQARA